MKDETTINNLNNKAGKVPSSSDNGNWSLYDYVIDDTIEDYMYYQDIDFDNDGIYDYRGVYFIKYKPYYISYIPTPSDSYQDDNGFVINTLYWFKYERIEWKVLKEENNKEINITVTKDEIRIRKNK